VAGRSIHSSLDERVVGFVLEHPRRVPAVVAMAKGPDKRGAIKPALGGRWVRSLITDLDTAHGFAKRLPAAR
jgi:DNA-binding transcriptional regulator LsrR (DeoR family)